MEEPRPAISSRPRPRGIRPLLTAIAIAAFLAIALGVVNGWIVGEHYEDIVRAWNETRGRRYRTRAFYRIIAVGPYFTPLSLAGIAAYFALWRVNLASEIRILVSLAVGALLGWVAAWITASAVSPEHASNAALMLIVPAALFFALPMLKFLHN